MAINNKKYLLLALIFFGFMPFLYSQNAGYFTEEDGEETKYFQRFVWRGGEYALYYEVVFEREINGEYRSYLKETTTSQFIELSLPPGNYRFRVIPYDILGKPAEGSSWANAQVLAIPREAPMPEPEPEPETEIEPESELAFEDEHEPRSEEEFEVRKREPEKKILFRIGMGLGLRFNVYGNKYFGENADPYFGLRTNLMIKAPLDIYIGPEFTIDVNRYGNIEHWSLYYYTYGFNILTEKWSPKKTVGVGFRLGLIYPSIDIQKNWRDVSKEQQEYFNETTMGVLMAENDFSTERIIVNIGASIYFLIKKHLLIDIGFNYFDASFDIFSFSLRNDPNGFFCPMIGISYQY